MGIIYKAPPLAPEEERVLASIEEARAQVAGALHGFLQPAPAADASSPSTPAMASPAAWYSSFVSEAWMSDVLQLSSDSQFAYSKALIQHLHRTLVKDETKNPGKWRRSEGRVSNSTGEIVYVGAEAKLIPSLMRALVEQLNQSGGNPPALIRAAMAHLNLIMIHPFIDGNGRTARCLQTLVLTREWNLEPQFCAIEEYLRRNTPAYHQVMGDVGQGSWHPNNDARPWIRFCLTAQHWQMQAILRHTRETERLWEEVQQLVVNQGLPERTLFALAEAAAGNKVQTATYGPFADVSEDVAASDLAELVARGLLVPRGKRMPCFVASDALKALRDSTREPDSPIEDPFGLIQNRLRNALPLSRG